MLTRFSFKRNVPTSSGLIRMMWGSIKKSGRIDVTVCYFALIAACAAASLAMGTLKGEQDT